MIAEDYSIAMLINEMNIHSLMIHAQQIKKEKFEERSREAKRANMGDGYFLHTKSNERRCCRLQKTILVKVPPMLRLLKSKNIWFPTLRLKSLMVV